MIFLSTILVLVVLSMTSPMLGEENSIPVCQNSEATTSKQESPMLEVRIDPTAELWTSPGTYRAVTFYVSLKDNDTSATVPAKNVSIIDAPSDSGVSLLVSHYERFPRAPKRHAQFVKSLRPKSLDLRSNSEAEKITLTIFAPDYVDNGTQVIITLVLQEKPSVIPVLNKVSVKAEKAFYFTVSSIPLNQLDRNPPVCEKPLICTTWYTSCEQEQSCAENRKWEAVVNTVDKVSGLKSVKSVSEDDAAGVGRDHDLRLIGDFKRHPVGLSGSCCEPKTILNLTDSAGNFAICEIFANDAKSFTVDSRFLIIVLSILTIIFQ